MKKLFVLALLPLFLCGFVYTNINLHRHEGPRVGIHGYNPDWYAYVGKKVLVVTNFGVEYKGTVYGVVQMDHCIYKDAYGNCLWSEFYYTMLLHDDHADTVVIRCESIYRIAEIE